MNIEVIKNRKGAQKAADIPSEVLSLLNTGTIETVNLTEWLAIDHSQLVKSIFPTLGIDKSIIEELVCQINQQKKPSTMNTIRLIGALLYQKYANTNLYEPLFEQLSNHLSDCALLCLLFGSFAYRYPSGRQVTQIKTLSS